MASIRHCGNGWQESRLFIVRHCQSEANRDQRAEARGDSGLTETGIKQAQLRGLSPAIRRDCWRDSGLQFGLAGAFASIMALYLCRYAEEPHHPRRQPRQGLWREGRVTTAAHDQ
jgi:hypothetical protein